MSALIRIVFASLILSAGWCASASAAQDVSDIAVVNLTADYQSAQVRLKRGAFYYNYYNSEYQSALNTLAQLQAVDPRSESDNELRLMHAAVLLSLGLTEDAQRLFASAGAGKATANAWFYLARAFWQNSQWLAAGESAAKALSWVNNDAFLAIYSGPLTADYLDEANFLLVSSLAAQDKVKDAEKQLQKMPARSIWTGLARYNLIIAHIRLYTPGPAIESLVKEAVYYLPDTEEAHNLRDRIYLVAGINALNEGKTQQAADHLKRISLDSIFTAPGLLQYGWALAEQQNYQRAMQPWRLLQEDYQPFHPAVMESLLAVPHALELLDARTQSLQAYEATELRLQEMLTRLSEQGSSATVRNWLNSWLLQQDENWGWQRTVITDMPDGELSATVQGLLDNPQFVALISQLHDLHAMHNALLKQQENMTLWADTIKRRQDVLVQTNGRARLQAMQQQQQALTQRILALSALLSEEDSKIFAYASEEDKANVERLQNVVPRIRGLQQLATPTRDVDQYAERWRRARGLQLWEIYEHTPQRRWDVNQSYWQLQTESMALLTQLNHAREALVWADSSWQGFPQRIAAAQQRIQDLLQRTDDRLEQTLQLTANMTEDYLSSLEQRITDYQGQARLSIARLYDDALQQSLTAADETDQDAVTEDVPAKDQNTETDIDEASGTSAAAPDNHGEVAGE